MNANHGPIRPATLAAIRDSCAPGQFVTPEDDPDVPQSRAWWRARNQAYLPEIIPPRYADATTDRTAVHDWVLRLVTNPRTTPSLLLAGNVGTGKTHTAYAALRLAAESARLADWKTATSAALFGDLRPSDGRDTEKAMAEYLNTSLLFLDDLGAAKASEWTEEVLYRLIDHRYNHCLPGIYATNLLPEQISAHLGERVASRLAGSCQVVSITGPDRRRTAP